MYTKHLHTYNDILQQNDTLYINIKKAYISSFHSCIGILQWNGPSIIFILCCYILCYNYC